MECRAISEKLSVDLGLLLEEAAKGNQLAFDQLIREIEDDVVRTACYLTKNLHDARDVAQEVYVRLVRNRQKFKEVANFRAWIHSVTVNAARDHLRRKRAWLPLEIVRSWINFRDRVEAAQLQSRLGSALQSLSFRQRAVFILCELHELSTRECSAALGCAESTVRVHLMEARKKLRRHFEDYRS